LFWLNKTDSLVIPCIRSLAPGRQSIYTFAVSPEKLLLFARLGGPEALRTAMEVRGAELLPNLIWTRDWQSGHLLVGFSRKMDFHLQARINRTHSVGTLDLPTGRRREGILVEGGAGRAAYRAARRDGRILSIVAFEAWSENKEATR
jgi:hypothetical protein